MGRKILLDVHLRGLLLRRVRRALADVTAVCTKNNYIDANGITLK